MDLQEIKDMSAYELARIADCGTPDSRTSPGAEMLIYVRDAIVEAWQKGELDERFIDETVDDAPDVMTHPMWLQFVDLLAYQESIEGASSDFDDRAREALCQIASRLAYWLRDALADIARDADGEDEGVTGTINDHRNDTGDWCPWSLTSVVRAQPGDRCPADCRDSRIDTAE